MADLPETMRKLTSEVTSDGVIELRLADVPVPTPRAGEVLIRVEAAPINPSDLALLLSVADVTQAKSAGTDEHPVVTMPLPPAAMGMLAGRIGQALDVGNEGAGTVVAAGDSDGHGLVGRRVAAAGGAMYADYQVVPVALCMPLPDGVSAREGASSFVNPMTALAMTEVMRRDGAKALVHTAAASNLGRMLQRICAADGIPLINVVRKPEQQAILKDIGADYALNSQDADFMKQLIAACSETQATLAFDAVGGGALAGQLLTAMEAAAAARMTSYSRYGSDTYKHVYIYGRLDLSPTVLPPSAGMSWGVGGFLLPQFLAGAGNDVRMRMAGRVMAELTTTFASSYTDEISLADTLDPDIMAKYNARRTGEKYLIDLTR